MPIMWQIRLDRTIAILARNVHSRRLPKKAIILSRLYIQETGIHIQKGRLISNGGRLIFFSWVV